MGTQQILMIILSVIVVGTAIAVGIQMFDTQLENQTRNTLAAELMQQMSMAQAWYRTPVMMGGGGNGKTVDANGNQTVFPATEEAIAMYINRGANNSNVYRNLHGEFTVEISGGTPGAEQVTISAKSDVVSTIGARIVFMLGGTSALGVEQLTLQ